MNAVDEQIRFYAKQLKIQSFAEHKEVLRQADPSSGFSDLLLELMKSETASRQENQNRRRLKAAGFPYLKTMEEFDSSQLNDAVSPLFLQELASCQFIQNKQNIIMIGNPGRGKTHLAIALGLKACTRGYNVLFKNAASLSTELCEAKDNYHLGKLERTLAKADLLIQCIRRRETTVEPFKSDTPTAEIRHSFRWSDSWGCKRGDRLICQPPRRLT